VTAFLLDTNIVLRLVDRNAPEHPLVRDALASLLAAGNEAHLAPQVLIEFWVVATRPREVNGFGWEPVVAATAIEGLLRQFPLLDEGPAVFSTWLRLVSEGIRGKRAHDARLSSVALANGVSRVLTLNVADFSGVGGLIAVHPRELMNK
jgi:predicted nucleic acid-binding protein